MNWREKDCANCEDRQQTLQVPRGYPCRTCRGFDMHTLICAEEIEQHYLGLGDVDTRNAAIENWADRA